MTYVATEICDETGSWLSDFVISGESKLIQSRNFGTFNKNSRTFKELSKFHTFKTTKILIRSLSKMEEELSYRLHTNRELSMMLSGDKPFSVFYKHYAENIDVYNGQKFEKFGDVISSAFRRIANTEYYFKFLNGEGWRVDAYCTVQRVRSYLGNSSYLEAVEGELLGYSPKQNMEYVKKFYRKTYDGN